MTDQLEDKVREIVAQKLKVEPGRVTRGANFIDDLGADSLDVTDLFLTLEKELGRPVAPADSAGPQTFGALLDCLSKGDEPAGNQARPGFWRRLFGRH